MEKSVTAALRAAIVDALYRVSANLLADVAEAVGLAPGTRDEAFSSKQLYVSKRLAKLTREDILAVAGRVLEEYHGRA